MKNVLIIKANLLPFYNEGSDTLETENRAFPADALAQLESFGDCKLELIDEEEAHFVRLGE